MPALLQRGNRGRGLERVGLIEQCAHDLSRRESVGLNHSFAWGAREGRFRVFHEAHLRAAARILGLHPRTNDISPRWIARFAPRHAVLEPREGGGRRADSGSNGTREARGPAREHEDETFSDQAVQCRAKRERCGSRRRAGGRPRPTFGSEGTRRHTQSHTHMQDSP